MSRRRDSARAKRRSKTAEGRATSESGSAGATTSDPEFEAQLERAKAQSVAQLLFKCARLLNERAVARLDAPPGIPRLRPAHTSLFPHLDMHGLRLTELARRLGITKQAVGQLVDELVEMEVVERVPDPADGRAKLIRFSPRGGAALLDGLAHLARLERELAEQLGEARMLALHETLTRMLELLERSDSDPRG